MYKIHTEHNKNSIQNKTHSPNSIPESLRHFITAGSHVFNEDCSPALLDIRILGQKWGLASVLTSETIRHVFQLYYLI